MRKAVLAIASLALGFSVSACRQDAAPPAAPAAPEAGAQPATAVEPAPAVQATSATPASTPVAPSAAAAAAPAAIASADGEKSGIRIEVTELKRSSGDTVSLKFVLVNDSDQELSISSAYLGDRSLNEDYQSVGGVHLVDPVGKKKYMVVRDSERQCVCSNHVQSMPAHSRTNLWAKYPAPPAGTTVVSIVVPHFSPMDDVPIAQ
jgi:hypothetical protein